MVGSLMKQSEQASLENLWCIAPRSFGIVLLVGSWNALPPDEIIASFVSQVYEKCTITEVSSYLPFKEFIRISHEDETIEILNQKAWPVPPAELPALALALRTSDKIQFRYVTLNSKDLLRSIFDANLDRGSLFSRSVLQPVEAAVGRMALDFNLEKKQHLSNNDEAVRIFVAGDRSSVGKSSVCLGILGSLREAGYEPDSLAYIKPATQSESTQLIQLYCEQNGIACVPVGPLVYYRGFTRAYLAGETVDTEELLEACRDAVQNLARGKRVVLIDGVGFPAVGSICGTSNAAIARVCGYKNGALGVVLVGGTGVGAAVDSFNLNATYFEKAGVPVLGAIFNKLPDSGFYSLDQCRTQVTRYFEQSVEQQERGRRPFGFVPICSHVTGPHALDHVDEFFQLFRTHVDVLAIVASAKALKESRSANTAVHVKTPAAKRPKLSSGVAHRSRHDIEAAATKAGAAPSA